jgi:homogentisate 1,2-dioxygenase
MAHYTSLGRIPEKRHTQFRSPTGKIYSEELVSTEGFSAIIFYAIFHPPTRY